MKITSVKGTNDYLPKEVELRDYLQNIILETYKSSGFERIITPALEDMENLKKSEGGENLSLLFKILKRGDKLEKSLKEGDVDHLSDIGLRYDLTLPLTRYYANNRSKLLMPFKCIQIDKVYRAERPQKGRLREFIQCDIDIIGSNSECCEVELINTTAKALLNLNIQNFIVKINDRRLLKQVLMQIGIPEEQFNSVCVSIDKLDKIGFDALTLELLEKGIDKNIVLELNKILSKNNISINDLSEYCSDSGVLNNLNKIIELTDQVSEGKYKTILDLTLVRGQGYYTGTIFEIESPDFHGAIAGGGRYNNLIGKFLNESIPAVGFSIGFERIYSILLEKAFTVPKKKRVAVIYNEIDFIKAMMIANKLRNNYHVMLQENSKKIGKLRNKLEEQGFSGYYLVGKSTELEIFD